MRTNRGAGILCRSARPSSGHRQTVTGILNLTGILTLTLVALAMMLVYDHAIGTRAWSDTLAELSSPTASLTPGQCSAGNLFSFENHNSYPIWLGEFVGNGGSVHDAAL
jgi:hypothetical protein